MKYIASGFQNQFNLAGSKDVFFNIYNYLLKNQNQKLKDLLAFYRLPSKLQKSNITLKLKDLKDVDHLFDSLGLTELLADQPSGRELLRELMSDLGLENCNSQRYSVCKKRQLAHCLHGFWAAEQVRRQIKQLADVHVWRPNDVQGGTERRPESGEKGSVGLIS